MEQEPTNSGPEFERGEQEIEYSVVIIKPDAFEHGIAGQIVEQIEAMGFEIIERAEVQLDEETIFRVWPDIYGEDWVRRTVTYLTSRPVVACVVRGEGSIQQMMKLKYQLREQYPNDDKVVTVMHASDSMAESRRNRRALFE